LDDPVRRRLYEVVTRQPEPLSRDEAAAAAGVGRALAVYHLDKLVESGLLAATYQRPAGRSGPGAGRPAKLYARADREFAVTVPPRSYELAARLLVQAVEADASGQSRAALGRAARRLGAELGHGYRGGTEGRGGGTEGRGGVESHGGGVESALARQGYEPCRDGEGVIRLRNCPFHQLAERHREVVCGMNLTLIEGLVEGLVEGLGADGLTPVLDPRPGYCCVALAGSRP
jgi:predicted ArsR family transcriptional regulator